MKKICYVDDDPAEIKRFKSAFQGRYVVGAGVTLDDAMKDLASKPDLFLLDLYYGPAISREQRKKIADADDEISAAEERLRILLLEADLSPEKGFDLAVAANRRFPRVPRVFFSRKASLVDALKAQKTGLPVVEKPDPNELDSGSVEDRYNAAMKRSAEDLKREFDDIMDRQSWWGQNHAWFSGLAFGFLFFFVQIMWDGIKSDPSNSKPLVIVSYSILSLACVVLAWIWR